MAAAVIAALAPLGVQIGQGLITSLFNLLEAKYGPKTGTAKMTTASEVVTATLGEMQAAGLIVLKTGQAEIDKWLQQKFDAVKSTGQLISVGEPSSIVAALKGQLLTIEVK